jgi:hypothetical protein
MIAAFVISLSLLGLSGLLIDSHRRSWREANDAKLPERDCRFAHSMYRRRMQASGTIGIMGAGVGVWPIVPRQAGPMALYTATLLAACAWIMVLAVLDVWATRRHYRRIRSEQLAKQLQLALEISAAGDSAEAEG